MGDPKPPAAKLGSLRSPHMHIKMYTNKNIKPFRA